MVENGSGRKGKRENKKEKMTADEGGKGRGEK